MSHVDPADYGRTVAALVALPELVARLEADVAGSRSRGDGRAGKPASRPPVDIGLVDDLDTAWSVVTGWARDWAETYRWTPPRPYWPDVCGFLGRHWPNIAATHTAAADFADEIAGVRSTAWPQLPSVWVRLSRHVDTAPRLWEPLPGRWQCPAQVDRPRDTAVEGPSSHTDRRTGRPVGNHTDVSSQPVYGPGNCGGVLLQKIGAWTVRCPRCGAHWDGDHQIELLGRALGCELLVTVPQAAALIHVHRATIDRWITAHILPAQTVDGRRWIDKRDLVALTTRQAGA